jgi:two-component system phosphate regulon sensor histidine kinase PhoR
VQTALLDATARPETGEAIRLVVPGEDTVALRDRFTFVGVRNGTGGAITLAAPVSVKGDTLAYTIASPQRVMVKQMDPAGVHDTTIIDTFRTPGSYQVRLPSPAGGRKGFMYRYRTDSLSLVVHIATGGAGSETTTGTIQSTRSKDLLVNRVVDRLVAGEQQPLERRLARSTLDSVLHEAFTNAGITLPLAYAVAGVPGDSLALVSDSSAWDDLRSTPYRARLFPSDLFGPRHELRVVIPGARSFVLSRIAPELVATGLFLTIIVVCLALTVGIILRQKRLAARVAGFINNMVHEFKTPLSTVALACEAIERPDVLPSGDRVVRYTGMIQEENRRMRTQVEKILQMAILERGDVDLRMETVDPGALLRTAVNTFSLQAEARGGTVSFTPPPRTLAIVVDPVHFTNIVLNLLDNAVKYSTDAPQVRVVLTSTDDAAVLRVEDRGPGIAAEHRRRVFDTYYRIPTGNLHDVKGFGLGLSYVRLMTRAMGGTVTLESAIEEGTTVEVRFPLAPIPEGE